MNELRINARLDEKAANDLKFLKDSTDTTNTEALKAALHFYAEHLRNEAQRSKQALLDSGFIGCFEGPEDLSTNYKKYVAEAIDAKYPPQKPDHC
jgi:S-ribosylhomocysteine lyase LuxS involved in autoinducer biosynthesis